MQLRFRRDEMARVQLQSHTVRLPPVEIVRSAAAQVDEGVKDVVDGFLCYILLFTVFPYPVQLL